MVLCIDGLDLAVGSLVLRVDHLALAPGEAVAVAGPNGSGKSTLLRAIAGVHRPRGGRIQLAGRSLWELDEARRRRCRREVVAWIDQEDRWLPYLTVAEHAHLARRLAGPWTRGDADRLTVLADRFGIADWADRRPSALSRGERQRAALVRALGGRPALILADEPATAIQADAVDGLIDALMATAAECEAALVVVSHRPGVLQRFDRIWCIEAGRVVDRQERCA